MVGSEGSKYFFFAHTLLNFLSVGIPLSPKNFSRASAVPFSSLLIEGMEINCMRRSTTSFFKTESSLLIGRMLSFAVCISFTPGVLSPLFHSHLSSLKYHRHGRSPRSPLPFRSPRMNYPAWGSFLSILRLAPPVFCIRLWSSFRSGNFHHPHFSALPFFRNSNSAALHIFWRASRPVRRQWYRHWY